MLGREVGRGALSTGGGVRGGGKWSGRGGGARDLKEDEARSRDEPEGEGDGATPGEVLGVALREYWLAKGEIGSGGLANGSPKSAKLLAEGDGEGEGVGVGVTFISSIAAVLTFSCDPRGTWVPRSLDVEC